MGSTGKSAGSMTDYSALFNGNPAEFFNQLDEIKAEVLANKEQLQKSPLTIIRDRNHPMTNRQIYDVHQLIRSLTQNDVWGNATGYRIGNNSVSFNSLLTLPEFSFHAINGTQFVGRIAAIRNAGYVADATFEDRDTLNGEIAYHFVKVR